MSDVIKEASRVDFTSTQVPNLPQLVRKASQADVTGMSEQDVPQLDNDCKYQQANTHTAAAFDAVQRDGDNTQDDSRDDQ